MTLFQFIHDTYDGTGFRPAIICNDGFRLSVQGSEYHYCEPRMTTNSYRELEIGFPSEKEELIMEWAENPDTPTETVYPYTPSNVIQEVIEKHGGIDYMKTMEKRLSTNPIN